MTAVWNDLIQSRPVLLPAQNYGQRMNNANADLFELTHYMLCTGTYVIFGQASFLLKDPVETIEGPAPDSQYFRFSYALTASNSATGYK